MRRPQLSWPLAAVALLAAVAPITLPAQVAPLSDAVIAQMLPVLRAGAAQAGASNAAVATSNREGGEYFQLLADIGAGKVDPRDWLAAKSKNAVAPAGAKYEKEFSRWLSTARLLEPAAAFSFKIEAPKELAQVGLGHEGVAEWGKSGNDPLASPGGKAVKALDARVAAFYASHKFSRPRSDLFYESTYDSGDEVIAAMFTMFNSFAGSTGAPDIGGGPILVIKLTPKANDLSGAPGAAGFDAALAKSGMTQDQYDGYLSAIIAARKDVADPSEIEPKAGTAALPPEIAKEMDALYGVRRKNADVYRRFGKQLEPLIAALGM